jgi:hypothetical protein
MGTRIFSCPGPESRVTSWQTGDIPGVAKTRLRSRTGGDLCRFQIQKVGYLFLFLEKAEMTEIAG